MAHDDPTGCDDMRSVGALLAAPVRALLWHARGSGGRYGVPLCAHCRGDHSETASSWTSCSPLGPPSSTFTV